MGCFQTFSTRSCLFFSLYLQHLQEKKTTTTTTTLSVCSCATNPIQIGPRSARFEKEMKILSQLLKHGLANVKDFVRILDWNVDKVVIQTEQSLSVTVMSSRGSRVSSMFHKYSPFIRANRVEIRAGNLTVGSRTQPSCRARWLQQSSCCTFSIAGEIDRQFATTKRWWQRDGMTHLLSRYHPPAKEEETSFNRNSSSWSAKKEQRRIDFRGWPWRCPRAQRVAPVVRLTKEPSRSPAVSHHIFTNWSADWHTFSPLSKPFTAIRNSVRLTRLVTKMPIECLQPSRWVADGPSVSSLGDISLAFKPLAPFNSLRFGRSKLVGLIGRSNWSLSNRVTLPQRHIFRLPQPPSLSVLFSWMAPAMSSPFQQPF